MRTHYPATAAAAKFLFAFPGHVLADDQVRSRTRQYHGKKKPPFSGKRIAYCLKSRLSRKPITPQFWSRANLERHCAKRSHIYGA
ncbi:MAG: hypothetical protein P1P84_02745 [Deferrisomatales bacterium]|nr:hypothetical protein [Deferrisomatales bacterium]